MKTQNKLFALLLMTLSISCHKDDTDIIPPDYRDKVVGTYDGIKIETTWQDTIVGFNHDTTLVSIRLKKSATDSIVDLCFGPTYEAVSSSFKFVEDEFIPTDNYHAPSLNVTDDSLIIHHQPSLAPNTLDYFTKKTN